MQYICILVVWYLIYFLRPQGVIGLFILSHCEHLWLFFYYIFHSVAFWIHPLGSEKIYITLSRFRQHVNPKSEYLYTYFPSQAHNHNQIILCMFRHIFRITWTHWRILGRRREPQPLDVYYIINKMYEWFFLYEYGFAITSNMYLLSLLQPWDPTSHNSCHIVMVNNIKMLECASEITRKPYYNIVTVPFIPYSLFYSTLFDDGWINAIYQTLVLNTSL